MFGIDASSGTGSPSPQGDLIKAVIAGAFTVFASLIAILINWIKERSEDSKHAADLDQATKIVDFWKNWAETQEKATQQVDPDLREKMTSQLRSSAERLTELESYRSRLKARAELRRQFEETREQRPRIKRWFLFYTPYRKRAWVTQAVFYTYLTLASVLTITSAGERIYYDNKNIREAQQDLQRALRDTPDNFHEQDLKREGVSLNWQAARVDAQTFFVLVVILFTLGFVLRLISIRFERP
jgi:hypothetical protein